MFSCRCTTRICTDVRHPTIDMQNSQIRLCRNGHWCIVHNRKHYIVDSSLEMSTQTRGWTSMRCSSVQEASVWGTFIGEWTSKEPVGNVHVDTYEGYMDNPWVYIPGWWTSTTKRTPTLENVHVESPKSAWILSECPYSCGGQVVGVLVDSELVTIPECTCWR